jgi:ribosome-associated protein
MLIVNSGIRIPLVEFQFTFSRSSGPGGQNVNKLNTKATLRWPVLESPSLPDDVRQRLVDRYHNRINAKGELLLSGQRYRDAARNVSDCLERLRRMLAAVAEPSKVRKRTKPTKASVRRRQAQKRRQSQKKQLRRPASE